jgi:DNA polymerase
VGAGNVEARVVLVGEMPGLKEEESGKPFVGNARENVEAIISSIGLKKEDVYMTYLLKCHYTKNDIPGDSDIRGCSRYIIEELDIIRPKVIFTLGHFCSNYLLKHFGITEEFVDLHERHGNGYLVLPKMYRRKPVGYKTYIVPTYNPAVDKPWITTSNHSDAYTVKKILEWSSILFD